MHFELTFDIYSLSYLQVNEKMKNISKEESKTLGLNNVEEKESKIQENIELQEATTGKMLSLPAPPVGEKEKLTFEEEKYRIENDNARVGGEPDKLKHKEEKRFNKKEKKMETKKMEKEEKQRKEDEEKK